MARVEIVSNRGPEAIHSWSGVTSADSTENYGSIVNVRLYTMHSYQVARAAGSGSSVKFRVFGSNFTDPSTKTASLDFEKYWSLITEHDLSAGSNFAYSDFWNFKFACIHIQGQSDQEINVFEKHNA